MSPESVCEICGRPGSAGMFRYSRHGTQVAEITSSEMKRCWSCKKRGCDHCIVVVEENADDHFIEIFSCHDCIAELRQ